VKSYKGVQEFMTTQEVEKMVMDQIKWHKEMSDIARSVGYDYPSMFGHKKNAAKELLDALKEITKRYEKRENK
jgi:hypothetical protein